MTDHMPGRDFYRRIVTQIKIMSLFFRPSPESASSSIPTEANPFHDCHPRGGGDPASSAILGEAILSSSSSVRDSIPEQHRAHFETLRQEIIDFAQARGIPRDTLAKPNALREAASKLSTPDLTRLANLLERFEYLLVHKEPRKEIAEALEYAEEHYHLREQYDFQVELLEQVGILGGDTIKGIDGKTYSIPTLEQIAIRLFERRGELSTKHDQGFTKLLIVPFGMSLDSLRETLKQFLIKYKESHSSFDINTDDPLWMQLKYQGADIGDSPNLVYEPQSFTKEGHGGKTKAQILKEQEDNQDSFPGWIVHLLQPSDPSDPHSPGFASIPREGQGTSQGDLVPRPSFEAGKTPNEYLSILQKTQGDKDSPYHGETGMTPEDWIMAFMIHLSETGKPLDNVHHPIQSCCLVGAFFPPYDVVPSIFWNYNFPHACFDLVSPRDLSGNMGVRSSVII